MRAEQPTPLEVYESLKREGMSDEQTIVIRGILDNRSPDTPPAQAYLERWKNGQLKPAEIALIAMIRGVEVDEKELQGIARALADNPDHESGLAHAISIVIDRVRERVGTLEKKPQKDKGKQRPGAYILMMLRQQHRYGALHKDHIRAIMLFLDKTVTGETDFKECTATVEEALDTNKINEGNKTQFRANIEKILKLSLLVLQAVRTKEDVEQAIRAYTEEETRKANRTLRAPAPETYDPPAPKPAPLRPILRRDEITQEMTTVYKRTPGRRVLEVLKKLFSMEPID